MFPHEGGEDLEDGSTEGLDEPDEPDDEPDAETREDHGHSRGEDAAIEEVPGRLVQSHGYEQRGEEDPRDACDQARDGCEVRRRGEPAGGGHRRRPLSRRRLLKSTRASQTPRILCCLGLNAWPRPNARLIGASQA